ncbi:MAG: N-acetyl-gamma-glutamyl-phosphate reductase [Pseudomonadota bacterium]
MAGVVRLGLVGGRGYVGEELLKLLLPHPAYRLEFMVSRSLAGQRLSHVFPDLSDLPGADAAAFETMDAATVAARDIDVVVLARSNGEAAEFVEALDAAENPAGVVDISADYRFDPAWTYGLPEVNRETLKTSKRVANPGCYATATELGLLPLLDHLAGVPAAFGVSGYSGAGRTPSERNNPDRLADNLLPYKLSGHLHEAEVSHQLGHPVAFMPHVAAFFRGISVTLLAELKEPLATDALLDLFREYYQAFPLITVDRGIPEIAQVRNRPAVRIGGFSVDARNPRQVRWVACIDNLLKGAASQALENLNLMHGLDHLAGLDA